MSDKSVNCTIGIDNFKASTSKANFSTYDNELTVTFYFVGNERPQDSFKRFLDRLEIACKEESITGERNG